MQIDSLSTNFEQLILNSKKADTTQPAGSFADQLASSSGIESDTNSDSGTVTLNFHNMTGDQFLAVEHTLMSEGKTTRGFLSPADNDNVPTDQIAMYGSWARQSPSASASFLDDQKAIAAQGDSAGNVTVDAATYNTALALFTGSGGQ